MLAGSLRPRRACRPTQLYFVLSGLDAANRLDRVDAKRCIDWIYAQQVEAGACCRHGEPQLRPCTCLTHTRIRAGAAAPPSCAGPDQPGGFRGSPCMGSSATRRAKVSHVDTPHIAMTYTALACLLLLGDDLSRVDRAAISTLLEVLQQEDGRCVLCARPGVVRRLAAPSHTPPQLRAHAAGRRV